jgi:hypothetical protein
MTPQELLVSDTIIWSVMIVNSAPRVVNNAPGVINYATGVINYAPVAYITNL